jgi:hypothetical protein
MGTLRPTPKALGEIRMMGQNWLRLYSFAFTIFKVLSTSAASNPNAFITLGSDLLSMY